MEPVTSEKDSHNVESTSNLDSNNTETKSIENGEKKKNIIFCISNSKSRLMVNAVVHYMNKIGIDGNFFIFQKNGIAQNRFYFSQRIDTCIRNQFLRNLNFIPVQSLDISREVESELQGYSNRYSFDVVEGTYTDISEKEIAFIRPEIEGSVKEGTSVKEDAGLKERTDFSDTVDIVLFLKDLRIDRHNVRLHSDTEEGIQNMLTQVELFVGGIEKSNVCAVNENKIRYGGASSELLGFLKGYFESLGISNIQLQQSWDESDKDIFIQMQDPSIIGKPLKDWMPLLISCDEPSLEQQLVAIFYKNGFKKARMATERERTQRNLGFTIFENSYKSKDPFGEITNEIQSLLSSFLDPVVNLKDYPIQVEAGSTNHYGCLLHIPIQEYRNGMAPYVGDGVGSYPIKIYTNKPEALFPLQEKLKKKGYNVYIEETHDNIQIANVSWGLFSKHSQSTTLMNTLEQYMHDAGLTRKTLKISDSISKVSNRVFGPPIVRDLDDKSIQVHIFEQSSTRSRRRQSHQAHLTRRFRVVVNINESEPSFHQIRENLEEIGIRRVEGRGRIPEAPEDNTIHFGMAPSWLISQIMVRLETFFDPKEIVHTEETFLSEDRDIYIFLPKNIVKNNKKVQKFDPQAWLKHSRETKNFLEDGMESSVLELTPLLGPPYFIQWTLKDNIRIGRQFLRCKNRYEHPLTPDMNNFQHYCLDSQTAILCERVCESINHREPLLLEGLTSTSKTSSILFLAACIGQPTMRINLSGATDVSEFVGRFIPDERDSNNGWRWEDGPIVKAMLEGYWVILDELNLAEASVLERLNSILEAHPRLLLSEHNDRLIGSSEYPLHDDFRVFATQNPVTYAGRNPLSPAYRDRFHEIQVKDPNIEPQYIEDMLMWIVFEKPPVVDVFGLDYKGAHSLEKKIVHTEKEILNIDKTDKNVSKDTKREISEVTQKKMQLISTSDTEKNCILDELEYIQMRDIPNIKEFLHYLSIFHASLCSACSEEHMGISTLGIHRPGGYAFTRRGLMRLLNYLEHSVQVYSHIPSKNDCDYLFKQALTRTYLERVDIRDAEQVANLLDAAGIGPNTWII